jgi:hypothetical protein
MTGALTDECNASANANCCYCTCFLDGEKIVDYSVTTSCACKANTTAVSTSDCTGDDLTNAQNCLNNEVTCKSAYKTIVDVACLQI